MNILIFVLTIILIASQPTQGQVDERGDDGMVPLSMDWEKFPEGDIDLSFLKEKPAGEKGYIRIKNDHFYTPSGKRFRI